MFLTNLRLATMTDGYGLIDNAVVEIRDGRIVRAAASDTAVPKEAIDCKGKLLTPGLIDCHTHLVYGGNRANEFEMRLNGATYTDIAKAGGGIASTVKATRAATDDALRDSALKRLDSLLNEGVTTIEIKSGYGLDVDTERRMLRVARSLAGHRPVDVVTTYLGAHTMPPASATTPSDEPANTLASTSEHQRAPANTSEQRAAYLRLICEEALPAIAREGLADAVDGFCETIAFDVKEMEQVFRAAKALDLPVKLHAEQLSNLGGAKLAARFHALSVDHIEYLDEDGVDAIAESGTVAVLLPGAFYYLREKQLPPVDALRFAGVPIAVATDLNPGTSPVHSLLTAMNMACVLFHLTPEEALRGVTVNAARALGLADRGVIAPGMKADLALWDVERPGDLAYPLGFNPLLAVIRNGEVVRGKLP